MINSISRIIVTKIMILVGLSCSISILFVNQANANNASYISLSGQIARKNQLDVTANNVANINTTGFEQDAVITRDVKVKQNSRNSNSFVWTETTYRNGEQGAIKITNRPTDVAISGEGYFKVMTPRGTRYTLDGSMFINNQGVLVNSSGYPYLSTNNSIIEIPAEFQNFDITSSGAIFIDGEEIERIGVFGFTTKDPIIKEGGNLYSIKGADFALEEFTLISGAVRGSNVNSTKSMVEMIEVQRDYSLMVDFMSKINETETSAINKLAK
ncbi:MAG: flagellar hook basal-body protein [Rickettsiales bacterium]|nr:MAG: flagellar hook basal-body protein [Rickettsiales bacterium]